MPHSPPVAAAFGPLERFRRALDRAGFCEERISALLEATSHHAPDSPQAGRTMFRTRGGDAFSTLARLFLLYRPVGENDAKRALEPATIEDVTALGLAHAEAGRVYPHVTLLALDGILMACDPPSRLGGETFADMVNGPTDPTGALERFAIRRPARNTLDLGTGCGYVALLARRWSERTAGTDCNARALEFCAFNAALNGIEGVRWHTGDLFAPVQGEAYDSILSNPPFLITPSRSLVYRDGGMEGDAFARRIACEAPAALAEGGMLQMIFEWVHPRGEDWRGRLKSWFVGSGCDVWILHHATVDPAEYADDHITVTEPPGDTEGTFRAWTEHYRKRGYQAFGSGFVAMRRRSAATAGAAPNWIAIDDLPHDMPAGFGERVLRYFAARDLLAQGDGALLDAVLEVSPGAALVRLGNFGGGLHIDRLEIKLDRALPYAAGIDAGIESFLARLDGVKPLGQVLGELSQSTGGGDVATLLPQVAPFLAGLLEQGILVAAGTGRAAAPSSSSSSSTSTR